MFPAYELIGRSSTIRDLEQEIAYAAVTDAKVLITGESGVGKEVVARLIHQRSRRAHAPLVAINCAGLPDTLLETAHGGTVFMDEMGEMSLRMQAVLLRFLETGEVQRVGSDRAHTTADVRIVAATNRNLPKAIREQVFREDLYYRINVVHLCIAPLRDRRDDIEPLLDYYMRRYAVAHGIACPTLTPAALAYLQSHNWPGNVRELKNLVERVVVRTRSGVIDVRDLPADLLNGRQAAAGAIAVPAGPTVAQRLYDEMVRNSGCFWSVVHEPFMARDITREDLRQLVLRGLERTQGNYKSLVRLFNMPPQDYKRFLNFLRKYQCQMPFQRFRAGAFAPAAEAAESALQRV